MTREEMRQIREAKKAAKLAQKQEKKYQHKKQKRGPKWLNVLKQKVLGSKIIL